MAEKDTKTDWDDPLTQLRAGLQTAESLRNTALADAGKAQDRADKAAAKVEMYREAIVAVEAARS